MRNLIDMESANAYNEDSGQKVRFLNGGDTNEIFY